MVEFVFLLCIIRQRSFEQPCEGKAVQAYEGSPAVTAELAALRLKALAQVIETTYRGVHNMLQFRRQLDACIQDVYNLVRPGRQRQRENTALTTGSSGRACRTLGSERNSRCLRNRSIRSRTRRSQFALLLLLPLLRLLLQRLYLIFDVLNNMI